MWKYFCAVVLCLAAVHATAQEIPALEVRLGEMVEDIECFSDPTQTYTLYVPSTYTSDRKLPVLLVFDPRGRSLLAAELFREAAEDFGWIIVSSDNTRSDGPWEPNLKAIQALWPEIHTRIPIDFSRVYAAGFSGGVAVATLLARTTGEIAGIIGTGGRKFENQFENNELPFFGFAGDTDFNFLQMHLLDEFLAENGNPHRLAIFDGTTPGCRRQWLKWWLDGRASRDEEGVRDRDPEIIRALYEEELAGARSLIAQGRAVEAVRGIRETERTYEGLYDVSEAKAIADRIETTDQYERQFKKTRRIQDFEMRCLQRRNVELTRLRNSDVPPPTRKLAGDLYLKDLKRDALRSTMRYGGPALSQQLVRSTCVLLPLSELPKGNIHRWQRPMSCTHDPDDSPVVCTTSLRASSARPGIVSGRGAGASLDLGFTGTKAADAS